ncbi:MAG: tetratricopeptide repeat protein, partial [Treponema sp.]|nr:tetratricopeptide repeat protein [Treponema sp.]
MDKRIIAAGAAAFALILFLSGSVIFLLWERNAQAKESARAAARELEEQARQERQRDLALIAELLAEGNFQKALELVDRLLAGDPGSAELITLRNRILGEQMLAAGDYEGALEFLESLLAGDPGNEELLALRDKILREWEIAKANAEPGPEEIEAQLRREAEAARRRAEREELARASRELQAKMQEVNDLISQGRALLERGDFAGAERLFAEARSRMPPGETRFEAQKLADMAEAWYEVFARQPNTPEGAEAAKKAAALAQESIALDPRQALPHYTLGKIGRDLKDWDSAIAEFGEAARLDSANYIYAYDLGRSLFSARRYVDARGAFEAAVKLNPRFETGWYNLGGTLRILNRH